MSLMQKTKISVDEEYNNYEEEIKEGETRVKGCLKDIKKAGSGFENFLYGFGSFISRLESVYPEGDEMKLLLKEHDKQVEGHKGYYLAVKKSLQNVEKSLEKHKKTIVDRKPIMSKRDKTKINYDNLTSKINKIQKKPQKEKTIKKLENLKIKYKVGSKEYQKISSESKYQIVEVLNSTAKIYDDSLLEIVTSFKTLFNDMTNTFSRILESAKKSKDIEREERNVNEIEVDFDSLFGESESKPSKKVKKEEKEEEKEEEDEDEEEEEDEDED